jgi:nucleotidyltransferase substrate binding protein (TIGR01987 family)
VNDETSPRWELRFEHFRSALRNLEEAIEELRARPLSILEQAGVVQLFEIAWQLGWKLMRDYLAELGVSDNASSAVGAIRAAFAAAIIDDGDSWMAAAKLRNTLSHEYHPDRTAEALTVIADRYLALFQALADKLGHEAQSDSRSN